ncbi:hypothetical protein ABT104_01955 [Streptomyces mobaraensis]|uniref:hypothetical protein n=1 Tax=Streptomyces mobaraensis TaxID=35621 RepID=UPI00331C6B1C
MNSRRRRWGLVISSVAGLVAAGVAAAGPAQAQDIGGTVGSVTRSAGAGVGLLLSGVGPVVGKTVSGAGAGLGRVLSDRRLKRDVTPLVWE